MSLTELIAGVEEHEKTLTVFNGDDEDVAAFREQFHDRNLSVTAERTPSGKPDAFAVLSKDGEFVTAASLDDIRGPEADENDPDFAEEAYRPILDHLDETMFTSYSRADMVAASREIEDRAWRVGDGELHAGFQTLDVLTGESDTYDLLGEKERLDVHAYAADEGDAPTVEHYTVHVGETAEIRETWFVAYDGGGYDDAKCALLAEERAPGEFYGFWSYDPETVDYVIDYLTERYGGSERTDDGATV